MSNIYHKKLKTHVKTRFANKMNFLKRPLNIVMQLIFVMEGKRTKICKVVL